MRVSFLKCKQLCGRDMCTDTDADMDTEMDTQIRIQIHPRHVNVNGHGKHEKSPVFRPSANPGTDRKFNHKIW